MEFGNVGQHCSFKLCHQQDFLPFECDGCKQIFCTDHARADDHKCSLPSDFDSIYVIICPVCTMRIKIKNKQDPNEAWDKHSKSGGCVPKQEEKKQVKKCMADKCYAQLTSINKVTCPRCLKDICLKHRFEIDHQCTFVVGEIRNQQTAKSKLLQPDYFKQQQQAPQVPSKPVISQQDLSQLESAINKFGEVSKQMPTKGERCEVCGSYFREEAELIAHIETHFMEKQKPKIETEKCPKCPLRFAVAELVSHMQQDHFMY